MVPLGGLEPPTVGFEGPMLYPIELQGQRIAPAVLPRVPAWTRTVAVDLRRAKAPPGLGIAG